MFQVRVCIRCQTSKPQSLKSLKPLHAEIRDALNPEPFKPHKPAHKTSTRNLFSLQVWLAYKRDYTLFRLFEVDCLSVIREYSPGLLIPCWRRGRSAAYGLQVFRPSVVLNPALRSVNAVLGCGASDSECCSIRSVLEVHKQS